MGTDAVTLVELAPGFSMLLPARLEFDQEIQGVLVDGVLELNMTSEGVRPTGLHVHTREGVPITGALLRALPVWELTRAGIGVGLLRSSIRAWPGAEEWSPALAARLRADGPKEETLRWVAYFYALAEVLGMPPAKQVVYQLKISAATAGRWIRLAKDRGLINESADGEHPEAP